MAGPTLSQASLGITPEANAPQLTASASTSPSSEVPSHDPWIFREGRQTISGPAVVQEIRNLLQLGSSGWIDALIQAGELEAALADASHCFSHLSADLTDALAQAVCTGDSSHADRAGQILEQLRPPEWVNVSPPEGFTYYALHPLDFARVVSNLPAAPRNCAVIGIRSIGTTLSAMAMASLRNGGRHASRITVRPTGHPYSRQTGFGSEQQQWIARRNSEGCHFLIVDEGPGRSGSTFLSVAEALLHSGVERSRITMIGSRAPDLSSLCADNAAQRWSRFHYIATSPSVNQRFRDCTYVGGGAWREIFFPSQHEWPESWTQTERLKFISHDRRTLYKFEGMGRIGAQARARAFALSQAHFIPAPSDAGDGFLAYQVVEGRRLQPEDINSALIAHVARYLAFRSSGFPADQSVDSQLKQMVEFNIQQEFGCEILFRDDELVTQHPILVDGRMQPYEWIAKGDQFLKTDAVDHGDNHFFPGPCDIAWDLAGVVIEWKLSSPRVHQLLSEFNRMTGDDPGPRLPVYLLAYSTFRTGFCKMARDSARGSDEEMRLHSAFLRYREETLRLLQQRTELR